MVSDIVDYNNSVRASVIRGCDRSKPFLACCVPYLKLDGFAIEFKSANFKINTDCADVTLGVRVIRKSKKKTRLANPRVSDEKQFKEVVTVTAKR